MHCLLRRNVYIYTIIIKINRNNFFLVVNRIARETPRFVWVPELAQCSQVRDSRWIDYISIQAILKIFCLQDYWRIFE